MNYLEDVVYNGLQPAGFSVGGGGGDTSGLYYSKVQLDGGQLDNRYFTETESDARFAYKSHNHDDLYYTKAQLNAGQLNNLYYTISEINDWRNSVTKTEMGYLHGVASGIQGQINARAIISGTPVANQVATWINGTHIKGNPNLTFDGTTLVNKRHQYKQYSTEAGKTDWRLTLYNIDADLATIFNYDDSEGAFRNMVLGNITNFLYLDLANTRIGVNCVPLHGFDVNGTGRYTSNVLFDANIGTNNYVPKTTGWRGNYAGVFDIRRLFTNELVTKTFIADIDLALLSGHIVSKSVTQVSRDFTVPANSNTGTLYVEALPGHPTAQVFANNDWIRLQIIDRTGGGLTWVEVWGTVTSFVDDGNGEQHYTFTTQDDGGASGSIVHGGAAAQDFGQSGDGFIQQEAGYETHTPWLQVATWVTDPSVPANINIRSRLGNLAGITGQSGYGLVIRKDNDNYVSQWWNSDADWGIRGYVGGNQVFRLGDENKIACLTIENDKLYIGTGNYNNADTKFYVDNAGQFSLKDQFSWNGTDLSIKGTISTTMAGGNEGLKLYMNQIWENEYNNDLGAVYINYHGYHAGITKFRNTIIGDGKNAALMTLEGSAAKINNYAKTEFHRGIVPINKIHGANITINTVFDALAPTIPNTNNEMILNGSYEHGGVNMILSYAKRTSPTTINMYYVSTNGTAGDVTITDGSETTIDAISIA